MRDEASIIEELLKEAHALKTMETRAWTAHWLLSPIHGTFWLLRLDGSELIQGEWRHVLRVDWDDKLPDGSRLTDARNSQYLAFLQQAAFLIREDMLGIRSSNSHFLYIRMLKTLTQWLFTRTKLYCPAESGFANVDLPGIHDFMKKLTSGGLFEAGDYAARFLKEIDKGSYRACVKSGKNIPLYALPKDIVQAVVAKLEEMDFYSVTGGVGPNAGLRSVSRLKLAQLLQAQVQTFGSARAIAFFRQFEEDFTRKFGNLLVRTSDMLTRCIGHKVTFIHEIESVAVTEVTRAVSTLQCLEKLVPISPLALPPFSRPFSKSPLQRYFSEARKSEHTPWMPLDVSMTYLNESLRWVLEYGPVLVDFYVKANCYFNDNGLLVGPSDSTMRQKRARDRDAWVGDNLPQSLKQAGIEGWSSTTRVQPKKRCTVCSAMIIFFGACIYVISGLLPTRIDEVTSLKKKCLTFKHGCGYWIEKRKGKAVEEDVHETMNVPIPRVSATAVSLLLRLGIESQQFVSAYDHNDAKYLLYLPDFHSVESIGMNLRAAPSVNYAIDMFCDHVGLAPDKYGRRWYARVHENRKSFLLTFVWYFKFSALDAARWLAGHIDSQYILAYIMTNFDEGDATELEAQFLAEALWDFGVSKRRRHEIKNISYLYRRVCKRFHVSEISEVKERELADCLDMLLTEKSIYIDILNITTATGVHRIALRIRTSSKRGKLN